MVCLDQGNHVAVIYADTVGLIHKTDFCSEASREWQAWGRLKHG
jgi:hypothetical protein